MIILRNFFCTSIKSLTGAQNYVTKKIRTNNLHVYFASNAIPSATRPAFLAINQLIF